MEHKNLLKDMIVVWISVTALVCAALNMHISRNMLEGEDASAGRRLYLEEGKKMG